MSSNDIFNLKKWLIGVSVILAGQFVAVIGIAITDHFHLQAVSEQVALDHPRVEQMWWENQSHKGGQ